MKQKKSLPPTLPSDPPPSPILLNSFFIKINPRDIIIALCHAHGFGNVGITCPCNYEARIGSSQLPAVKKTSPTPYFTKDRGSSPIFLPDSKISGGSIGLERQKRCIKPVPKIDQNQKPEKKQNPQPPPTPTLPPSPKLGTIHPMVETPSPPTRYQQRNACISALLTPLVVC